MSKKSIWLGVGAFSSSAFILTVLPFLILLLLIFPNEIPKEAVPFLMLYVLTELFFVVLIWFYIIYDIIQIIKDKSFSPLKKTLWSIGIYCGNIVTIPIFWYLYQRDLGNVINEKRLEKA